MKKEYFLYIKEQLLINSNKPSFENDKTYYSILGIYNCYAYALCLKLPAECLIKEPYKDFEPNIKFKPGFTINYNNHYETMQDVLNNFYIDCENLELNIKKTKIQSNITDGYKVALFLSYICGKYVIFISLGKIKINLGLINLAILRNQK